MSADQMNALIDAHQRARPISRVAAYAAFSGWTTAVFAAFGLLCGLFSMVSFLLGAAMALIAWVELTQRRQLLTLDLCAPRRLAINQLGFACVLTVYGAYGLYATLTGPGQYASYMAQGGDLAEMLGPIERLTKLVAVCVYAALIALTWVFQGGAAAYYWFAQQRVRRYLAHTPPWVIALQQRTGRL